MNTCPVYRRSGGLSYGATYSGPIGLIIDPTFNKRKYSTLPFSSTMNGSCTNVCPVKINIHEQIFAWRKVLVEEHHIPALKQGMMKAAGAVLSRPAATGRRSAPRIRPEGAAALRRLQPAQHLGEEARDARGAAPDLPRLVQAEPDEGLRPMSARDGILAALKANRPAGEYPLPSVPTFTPLVGDDLVEEFGDRLKRMGGRIEDGRTGEPLAGVRERLAEAKVIASAVPEIEGNRDLRAVRYPQEVEDVDVAVVRAVFGIAETGSVLFTEGELIVNAVAYLAQHLIVLLDPADILPNVQAAYKRPEFGRSAYAVLHTGPSATADIEGVLIHGAQGVRSLTVLLLPR